MPARRLLNVAIYSSPVPSELAAYPRHAVRLADDQSFRGVRLYDANAFCTTPSGDQQ
jgi:hypothetical protein